MQPVHTATQFQLVHTPPEANFPFLDTADVPTNNEIVFIAENISTNMEKNSSRHSSPTKAITYFGTPEKVLPLALSQEDTGEFEEGYHWLSDQEGSFKEKTRSEHSDMFQRSSRGIYGPPNWGTPSFNLRVSREDTNETNSDDRRRSTLAEVITNDSNLTSSEDEENSETRDKVLPVLPSRHSATVE
eukprot:GHVR01026986.1.p1 GENE.GHVR01026986.1~~GHVR01026986.1.p1  ORF type:complete len:187 (-),score=5.36 GHVR01026986.1:686-1246(-)